MMKPTIILAILLLFAQSLLRSQTVDVWSRSVQMERTHNFDVLHYRIVLELLPKSRSYVGTTTVTLRALTENHRATELDAETYRVKDVRSSAGVALKFRHDNGILTVAHERAYAVGDTLSFTVSYRADSVDVDEVRYGMSKGYDLGLGFNPATEHRSAVINTLSFPTGARHWFPCYDHPNDKATTEVIATVDTAFSVLSNGDLLSVTRNGNPGTRSWHWYQSQPHSTYLTVLVAGDYVMLEDSLGSLPVRYWVYRSDAQNGLTTFGRTPEIIAFYNKQFGVAYPWSKYDQITIPGIGGGAESTTATVIGESAVVDERATLDWPADWLVAHEAAHQWWGDFVTMRDWSETWMNESFATYYEYVWAKHARGDDEGAWNMENKRRQYYREAETKYRRPIVFNRWNWPNENFDSHTYPKGAAVLHMLRNELGQEPFDASITHFLGRHPYGSVQTNDLIESIRSVTRRDMKSFFDQWVYTAGHPELAVSWSWDAEKKAVTLHVKQVQVQDDHVGRFRFPVEIEVLYDSGRSTARVEVTRDEETFVLPTKTKPRAFFVDPQGILLASIRYDASVEEDLTHLTEGNVVAGRKSIERMASRLADARVREALIRAGERVAFWRLRAQAIETLGGTEWKGEEVYYKARLTDTSSGVRASAVRAIRRRTLSSLVPHLLSVFEQEPSYLVQSEIVRTVGALDRDKNRGFLERAKNMSSFRSVIATAATEALGDNSPK